MKIYSVSTRHYFAFGALVSEELSYKLKGRFIFPLKVGVHGIIVNNFFGCRTAKGSVGAS